MHTVRYLGSAAIPHCQSKAGRCDPLRTPTPARPGSAISSAPASRGNGSGSRSTTSTWARSPRCSHCDKNRSARAERDHRTVSLSRCRCTTFRRQRSPLFLPCQRRRMWRRQRRQAKGETATLLAAIDDDVALIKNLRKNCCGRENALKINELTINKQSREKLKTISEQETPRNMF